MSRWRSCCISSMSACSSRGPSRCSPPITAPAFVWTTLHISFLNQLPVFLVGCALFFSLRDGFAKSDAAIYAVFIALSFVANRVTGSHEFNYLMINLVLGALVAGCIKLAIRFQPLEALGRNSYSMYLSLRGDLRPASALAGRR